MSNFCSDQDRTRVFGEAYFLYAAAGNPRRTQIRAKRAIYGWKQNNKTNNYTTDNKKYIKQNSKKFAINVLNEVGDDKKYGEKLFKK